MWKIVSIFFVSALLFGQLAFASQDEFCAGFTEGYRTAKRDAKVVPVCPAATPTPDGSTPFREGLKAGIRAARAATRASATG